MTDINKQIEENRYWRIFIKENRCWTPTTEAIGKLAYNNGYNKAKKEFEHSSRWRKVSDELPEDNKCVLVKINIQGYIHFDVDRIIYGEWGDNGIIEWKPID